MKLAFVPKQIFFIILFTYTQMNGEIYESIKFSSVHDLTVKLIVFL